MSLDKNPVNKKPLSVMFADDKPKVIGILPIESDKIAAFKEALIAANDAHEDLHVRNIVPLQAMSHLLRSCDVSSGSSHSSPNYVLLSWCRSCIWTLRKTQEHWTSSA